MGVVLRDTLKMYEREVNDKGGVDGHPLKLEIADTQGDATRTATLTEKFIGDGALSIVGGTNSTEALAIKSVAARRKTPYLATGGASVAVTTPLSPWTFQIMGRDDATLKDIAKIAAKDIGANKIAALYVENRWGIGGRDALTRELKDTYGLTPVAVESSANAEANLVPQMLRLKNSGADALVLWVSIDEVPVALKAMMQVGFNVPVLSNLACTTSNIALTGNIPIRNISHAVWSWDNPEAMAVAKRLEVVTGKSMKYEDVWAMPWNAMQILVDSLKRANLSYDPKDIDSDRQKLHDAIESTKELPVVGGKEGSKITFSPTQHTGYLLADYVNKETLNGVDWKMYQEK